MESKIIDLENYTPYFSLPETEGFSMKIGARFMRLLPILIPKAGSRFCSSFRI